MFRGQENCGLIYINKCARRDATADWKATITRANVCLSAAPCCYCCHHDLKSAEKHPTTLHNHENIVSIIFHHRISVVRGRCIVPDGYHLIMIKAIKQEWSKKLDSISEAWSQNFRQDSKSNHYTGRTPSSNSNCAHRGIFIGKLYSYYRYIAKVMILTRSVRKTLYSSKRTSPAACSRVYLLPQTKATYPARVA